MFVKVASLHRVWLNAGERTPRMAWTSDLNSIETAATPVRNSAPVPTTSAVGELMDKNQTAAFLGITPITLDRWIRNGSLPDGINFNGHRRWSKSALTHFIWNKFMEQQSAKKQKQTPSVQDGVR